MGIPFGEHLLHLLILGIQCYHLPDVIVDKVGLVEFRGEAEYPRTVPSFFPEGVPTDRTHQLGLSVLSSDHGEYFTVLTVLVFVHGSVYCREHCLLPGFQCERSRGKRPFGMVAVHFRPVQDIVCFLLVEVEVLLLQSSYKIFIDEPYPLAYAERPVFDTLIVIVYPVISSHILLISGQVLKNSLAFGKRSL